MTSVVATPVRSVPFAPGQPDGSPGEFIVAYAEFRGSDRDAGEPREQPAVILRLSSRVLASPDPHHSRFFIFGPDFQDMPVKPKWLAPSVPRPTWKSESLNHSVISPQ